jgi:pimeloyl-ACP methyl ester carboxylesterase
MPLRLVLARDRFDPAAPRPTPVVLVHGFFGDPTNFLLLRSYLWAGGMPNFATFAYPPRLDYQRLALRLGQSIDDLCVATGVSQVDVVGHSLGGLIARYLIEVEGGHRIRRLVTLGAPYFANPLPAQELAIFGEFDPFIPPPHPLYGPQAGNGGLYIVRDCGHWGLLYHPTAMREVTAFLGASAPALSHSAAALSAEPRLRLGSGAENQGLAAVDGAGGVAPPPAPARQTWWLRSAAQ